MQKWFPKETFWETIWRPWGHPGKVCFLTMVTHFSSIAPSHAGSQISLFGCCFWYLLRNALGDDIFADIDDFWLHGGSPGETISRLLADLWGVQFLIYFEEKGEAFFGANSDRGWSLLDVQEPARTCKWVSTRPATPASGGAADISPYPNAIRCYSSLFVRCYSSLFVAIRCYSSLFVAIRRYSLLFVVIRCYLSLFVAIIILTATAIRRYSLLFVVSTR